MRLARLDPEAVSLKNASSTTIIGGQVISRVGYYWWALIVGPCLQALGGGLLYIISPTTSGATIIGFQILIGVGLGLCMQVRRPAALPDAG